MGKSGARKRLDHSCNLKKKITIKTMYRSAKNQFYQFMLTFYFSTKAQIYIMQLFHH